MSTRPEVSIILPCRNERKHIEACLRDILAQEPLPDGGMCEVLVADGMSEDGTREIISRVAQSDPRVRLIDNPGRIVSSGLNAAISIARGAIVIRMDAHTEYAPDYVRECVAVLRESHADNVGGPWRARGVNRIERAIAAAFQSSFSSGGARAHDVDYEGELDTVYLGCWHRETLLAIGLFDEGLVRNQDDELNYRLVSADKMPFDETMVRTEDDELNLRISHQGGRVWQSPRIRSWYRPRSSLATLFWQQLQYGYWKVRVIQKHKRPASIRHLVPGGFVAVLFSFGAIGLIWHPAWWAAGALLLAYLFANFAASVHCAVKNELVLLPILPAVFGAYHFGYGIGFLCGILDFGIRHKGSGAAFTSLTRD
jgi:glycosyltransferase involved in cell wall biosynthesis